MKSLLALTLAVLMLATPAMAGAPCYGPEFVCGGSKAPTVTVPQAAAAVASGVKSAADTTQKKSSEYWGKVSVYVGDLLISGGTTLKGKHKKVEAKPVEAKPADTPKK